MVCKCLQKELNEFLNCAGGGFYILSWLQTTEVSIRHRENEELSQDERLLSEARFALLLRPKPIEGFPLEYGCGDG